MLPCRKSPRVGAQKGASEKMPGRVRARILRGRLQPGLKIHKTRWTPRKYSGRLQLIRSLFGSALGIRGAPNRAHSNRCESVFLNLTRPSLVGYYVLDALNLRHLAFQ